MSRLLFQTVPHDSEYWRPLRQTERSFDFVTKWHGQPRVPHTSDSATQTAETIDKGDAVWPNLQV